MKVYLFQWADNEMSKLSAKCLADSIAQSGAGTLVQNENDADLIIICDRNNDFLYRHFIVAKAKLPADIPHIVVSTRDDPVVLGNGFYSNLSEDIHVPGMSKGFCFLSRTRRLI
jgi:hypothetical protein